MIRLNRSMALEIIKGFPAVFALIKSLAGRTSEFADAAGVIGLTEGALYGLGGSK